MFPEPLTQGGADTPLYPHAQPPTTRRNPRLPGDRYERYRPRLAIFSRLLYAHESDDRLR